MTTRPPWCGRCDQRTRQLLLSDDRAARCKRCHPLLVPTVPAAAPARSTSRASTPRRQPLPSAGGYLAPVDEHASDRERLDADAVVASFAATGQPFSANQLRPHFDAALVSPALRGARIAAALAAGRIVEVGTTRSTDPGTHGKRIGIYQGTAPASASTVAPPAPPAAAPVVPSTPATRTTTRCRSCGHALDHALASAGEQAHPTCPAPTGGNAAQQWARQQRPPGLTLHERLALLALARYADEQGGPTWPALDTLARTTGLDRGKLVPALQRLAARRLVVGLDATCTSCSAALVPVLAVDPDRQPACRSCGPRPAGTP